MARKNNKQMDIVESMLRNGWEARDIHKQTNLPRSTVYAKVKKLKKEARYDFDKVMNEDYLWLYQMNLMNYSRTIKQLNEEIERVNKKYDELEIITREALEAVEDGKHVGKSNLIANLIAINNSRANDMAKLTQQRDRASEMKARLFNQGPVVHNMAEWLKLTSSVDKKVLPVLENQKKQLNVISVVDMKELPFVEDMSKEDMDIIREMENDDLD
jgi:hypothetical protein